MKVVLDHLPGPRVRSILTSMTSGRVEVVFASETDKERLDREIEDCDVLLHVLRPVSSAVIEFSRRLLSDPENRGRCRYDRRSQRGSEIHRRVQHARYQYPGGGGAHVFNDVGSGSQTKTA